MWGIVLLLAVGTEGCSFACVSMCGSFRYSDNCSTFCGCGAFSPRPRPDPQSFATTAQCEEFCGAVAGGSDLHCMQTCTSHGGQLVDKAELVRLSGEFPLEEPESEYIENSQQAPSGMSLKCYQSCIEICGLSDNSDCLDLCTLTFCKKEISTISQLSDLHTPLSDPQFLTWFSVSILVLTLCATVLLCTSQLRK